MSHGSKFRCKYCDKEYSTSHSRSNHYRLYHNDAISIKLQNDMGLSRIIVNHSSFEKPIHGIFDQYMILSNYQAREIFN